jgi:Tfp pilus assembly protein PilV
MEAPRVVHHQVQLVMAICVLAAIHLHLQLKMQQEIDRMIDLAGQHQLMQRRLVEYKQASNKKDVYACQQTHISVS